MDSSTEGLYSRIMLGAVRNAIYSGGYHYQDTVAYIIREPHGIQTSVLEQICNALDIYFETHSRKHSAKAEALARLLDACEAELATRLPPDTDSDTSAEPPATTPGIGSSARRGKDGARVGVARGASLTKGKSGKA